MGDLALPIIGGCLCGAVRYEANEPPIDSTYCHCRMCQRWSGAPVVEGVGFRTGAVRITRGKPKYYQSSPKVGRGHCVDCGSSLFMRFPDDDEFWIGIGTLDHPENIQPQRHSGIEGQLPWFDIADDLPRIRTDQEPGTPAYEAAKHRS